MNIGPVAVIRGLCIAVLSLLAACATRFDPAPIVDLSNNAAGTATKPALPFAVPPSGFYRVRPGDTLSRIAIENGQSERDLAIWNGLANPDQIEVNQLLRMAPPGTNGTAAVASTSTAPISGGAISTPLAPGGAAAPIAPQPNPGAMGPDGIALAWPARGPLLNRFDDAKNKGIDIGGAPGEPVTAAADGKVVYAGSGLRGYGNLLIVKDNATFLTAYAHNRALMVREGDTVSKGQKIAEMGNTDSDHVMLHFELRRYGKPVDPLKYLQPR